MSKSSWLTEAYMCVCGGGGVRGARSPMIDSPLLPKLGGTGEELFS